MTLLGHIEGSMITAVQTHLRMFLYHIRILLKPVLGGMVDNLHFLENVLNRP
jgi:hypothetical protein